MGAAAALLLELRSTHPVQRIIFKKYYFHEQAKMHDKAAPATAYRQSAHMLIHGHTSGYKCAVHAATSGLPSLKVTADFRYYTRACLMVLRILISKSLLCPALLHG